MAQWKEGESAETFAHRIFNFAKRNRTPDAAADYVGEQFAAHNQVLAPELREKLLSSKAAQTAGQGVGVTTQNGATPSAVKAVLPKVVAGSMIVPPDDAIIANKDLLVKHFACQKDYALNLTASARSLEGQIEQLQKTLETLKAELPKAENVQTLTRRIINLARVLNDDGLDDVDFKESTGKMLITSLAVYQGAYDAAKPKTAVTEEANKEESVGGEDAAGEPKAGETEEEKKEDAAA